MRWRTQRSRSLLFLSTLIVLCLASLGVAQAAPIVAGHTDVAALGGIDGTINWAVWAPGTSDFVAVTFGLGTGSGSFDTSSNFIYAFEVTNSGSNTSPFGSASAGYIAAAASSITAWGAIHFVFSETVGGSVTASNPLDELPGAITLVGVSGVSGHKDACSVTNSGAAIAAGFNTSCTSAVAPGGAAPFLGAVAASEFASIFLYQSTLAPGFDSGSLQDGTSAFGPVPSPVPEPGTLLLLGSGLVAAGAWGRGKLNRRKA